MAFCQCLQVIYMVVVISWCTQNLKREVTYNRWSPGCSKSKCHWNVKNQTFFPSQVLNESYLHIIYGLIIIKLEYKKQAWEFTCQRAQSNPLIRVKLTKNQKTGEASYDLGACWLQPWHHAHFSKFWFPDKATITNYSYLIKLNNI